MATVKLAGKVCETSGDLPAVGSTAPDFRLTNAKLKDFGLSAFKGKKKILLTIYLI